VFPHFPDNALPSPSDIPEPQLWLERDDHGVTALSRTGPVAHVEVREDPTRVALEFWVGPRVPRRVCAEMTRVAFAHQALRPRRPVLAAVPHEQSEVLDEIRSHIRDAHTHVAGVTCLVEGLIPEPRSPRDLGAMP
jgi:hypothetical protein